MGSDVSYVPRVFGGLYRKDQSDDYDLSTGQKPILAWTSAMPTYGGVVVDAVNGTIVVPTAGDYRVSWTGSIYYPTGNAGDVNMWISRVGVGPLEGTYALMASQVVAATVAANGGAIVTLTAGQVLRLQASGLTVSDLTVWHGSFSVEAV